MLGIAAPAQATNWRVSGTLAGTYDNSVAWTQCQTSGAMGTASEHVDLDVRLRPAATARYTRGDPGFGAVFNIDVGGRWTVDGAYAPRHLDANGDESCGTPVPIACSGNVTNPSAGERSPARLLFARNGRMFLGQFAEFVEIREDQSGQPSACGSDSLDPTLAGGPLFGFAITTVQAPLVAGIYRVPVAHLVGRRAFTVSPTPDPSEARPCPLGYVSCSQTNRLAMQLTFKPAH